VKLALLRAITPDRALGIAWYLYPDESHNDDGRHVSYLDQPGVWRELDPELFDALSTTVRSQRSVRALESAGVLAEATYSGEPIPTSEMPAHLRSDARKIWFDRTLLTLQGCDLVFADPDNGLIDDSPNRRRDRKFGKQMPISEAVALSHDREAVIYHHNTRYPGGHDLEVSAWQARLGPKTIAIRANAYSCRTFFVLNASKGTRQRALSFAERWAKHKVRFVDSL
jgi:hypothetical protein